ncbi:MAG: UvrY/SirA/GacA family response regulator transcription factor [Pseudomonadales bacterium]|nr:UvrY/SirA/GacA family response regulator transcription factor [Pseudomonadales bacterium]
MIKVLVVDDHDLVRMGIARMLEDEEGIKVIGEASNGEDAIKLTRELAPDVVLMDVKMPGIGGLEATRKILRANAEVRIIAVTACAEEPFPSRVLQAGASGYLTKGAGIEEMVMAIHQVHHGQRYLSPEIAQALALKQLSLDGKTTPFETLSEREMQITIMIVNCQKVQEISDALCVSPKTVNSYRYRIFEKLEISSDVELTLLAMRHGIVDSESID